MISHSVVSDSLIPCRLYPARLLCPKNFLGKNTGVSCHFLLQGFLLSQELNPCLLCLLQVDSLPLSHQGSPEVPRDLFNPLVLDALWPHQSCSNYSLFFLDVYPELKHLISFSASTDGTQSLPHTEVILWNFLLLHFLLWVSLAKAFTCWNLKHASVLNHISLQLWPYPWPL